MAVGRGDGGTRVDLGGLSRHGKFPPPTGPMRHSPRRDNCYKLATNHCAAWSHDHSQRCSMSNSLRSRSFSEGPRDLELKAPPRPQALRLTTKPGSQVPPTSAVIVTSAVPRRSPIRRQYLGKAEALIREFSILQLTSSSQQYRHAPPLPVRKLLGKSWLGWHLWVHLQARLSATALHIDAGSEQR